MSNKVISNIWDVQDRISNYSKVVIYGAGIYGKLFLKKLYELNLYKKVVFAVTGTPEEPEVMGVDVYSINSFANAMEDVLIIVAVSEKLTEEMVIHLRSIGIENYVEFSNEFRSYLRNEKRITENGILYLEKKGDKYYKENLKEIREIIQSVVNKALDQEQKVIKENFQNINKTLDQEQRVIKENFQNVNKTLDQEQKVIKENFQNVNKTLDQEQKVIKENFQNVNKTLDQEQKVIKENFQNLYKIIEQQQELLKEAYQNIYRANERMSRLEKTQIEQVEIKMKLDEIYGILKGTNK